MRGASGAAGQTKVEDGAGDGLGVVEQAVSKAPSTNSQAPEKHQAPNFKSKIERLIGALNLELVWSLDVGAWRLIIP